MYLSVVVLDAETEYANSCHGGPLVIPAETLALQVGELIQVLELLNKR